MSKFKLRTVCCLVCCLLFCTDVVNSASSALYPAPSQKHRNHQVIFSALKDEDLAYYDDNDMQRHVKGRSLGHANNFDDDQEQEDKNSNSYGRDDIFQSLHRASSAERTDKWSEGPSRSGSRSSDKGYRNLIRGSGGASSETQRKIEEFMEEFYLKQLRIEMQKSQILHSFPENELPAAILAQRDNESSEDNMLSSGGGGGGGVSGEVEDDDDGEQAILELFRHVGSSIEQTGDQNEVDSELEDSLASNSWLNNFRPIYRFIKGHMERFEKELREHKRKMERVWKQVQEERHALEREDGDEPFDYLDFEHEAEQREIIFLDEGMSGAFR